MDQPGWHRAARALGSPLAWSRAQPLAADTLLALLLTGVSLEALTNAVRHAGPSRALVLVSYGDGDVRLEVRDDGAGPRPGNGAGHGLTGMRERVNLFGGDLDAGPRPDGGFAVAARLPLPLG
jgi:signal transduction histidine kinase